MKTPKHSLLRRTATSLVDLYGSTRKAGKKLGINYSYLSRMASGDVDDASDEFLAKLGLERIPGVEIHRRKQ